MTYDITLDVYGEIEYAVRADTPGKAIQKAVDEVYDCFGILYFPNIKALTAKRTGKKQYSVLLGIDALYDDQIDAENEDQALDEAYSNLNWNSDKGLLDGCIFQSEPIKVEEAI